MKLTRHQKQDAYIEAKKTSLLHERRHDDFYCKECGGHYEGHEIHILEGFGTSGNKHYVSLRYCCPKNHVIKTENSDLFSDTFVDHLIVLAIITGIILFTIFVFRYCSFDVSEYGKYR